MGDDSTTNTPWARAIRLKDFAAIADWFSTYFFGVGIIGIAFAGVAAGLGVGIVAGVRVFALSLLLAGACTVSGWLFGLLFGIPRTLARSGSDRSAASEKPDSDQNADISKSRVNTNLEEISDWLTKTIVGVGLTQLRSMPRYLGDLAANADKYGFVWYPHGHLLALSLILYFAPGGFWLGYVGTRTVLTGLFIAFDSLSSGLSKEKVSVAADPENLRLSEAGIQAGDRNLQAIDKKLLRTPVHALQTVTDVVAWAAARARSGDLEASRVALESALASDPGNDEVRRQLATIYAALKRFADSTAVEQGGPASPSTVLSSLYEDPPGGFVKAIAAANELLKTEEGQKDPSLHVWLSCAYAQKYRYQRDRGASKETLAEIKQDVVREMTSAIKLDASSRGWLYSLWQPAHGSIDDDLSVFPPNDPDISQILTSRSSA